MSVNLDKTKVMLFNFIEAWTMKLELEFFLGEEEMAYTWAYTFLGVTFHLDSNSPCERLFVLGFLVDIQPLVPL